MNLIKEKITKELLIDGYRFFIQDTKFVNLSETEHLFKKYDESGNLLIDNISFSIDNRTHYCSWREFDLSGKEIFSMCYDRDPNDLVSKKKRRGGGRLMLKEM